MKKCRAFPPLIQHICQSTLGNNKKKNINEKKREHEQTHSGATKKKKSFSLSYLYPFFLLFQGTRYINE